MKLISVEGQNVGLLRGKFSYEFDGSMTVITGPIGCGKSTILTMVRASLTNVFPGSASTWASWKLDAAETSYFIVTWKIGKKLLRIAKCLTNDKLFQTLNIPRLKIEHEDGKVEDIYGSKEALERTHSLIAIPPSVIDGHLVVDQDSITTPVNSSSAKFKETIYTLTRMDDLENLRLTFRDYLGTLVVPQVEEELNATKIEFNIVQGEKLQLESDKSNKINQLVELNLPYVNEQLTLCERRQANIAKRDEFTKSLQNLELGLEQSQVKLTAASASLSSLEQYVNIFADEYKKNIARLNQLDELSRKLIRYNVIKNNIAVLTTKVNEFDLTPPAEEPFDRAEVQNLVGSIGKLEVELKDLNEQKTLLLQEQCPVCKNPIKDAASKLVQVEKDIALKTQQLADYRSLLSSANALEDAWKVWEVNRNQTSVYKAQLAKDQDEFEQLRDCESFDDKERELLLGKTIHYQNQEKLLQAARYNVSAEKAIIDNYTKQVNLIKGNLDKIPSDPYNEHEHARYKAIHASAVNINTDLAVIDGKLLAKEAEIQRITGRLASLNQRFDQVKPILAMREIVERAITVLNKDNLPKLLALQSQIKLNERIRFYLNEMNADFAAYIDDNLDFVAKKNDGMEHKASRLSGGQKQQASIAYLLAVSDVFASSLGVLALDEPTGAMQESNARDMAEVFHNLTQSNKIADRQFIIVTHSQTLAAYGYKAITLEGSY